MQKKYSGIKKLDDKQVRALMEKYKFDALPTIHECFRKWSYRGQIVKTPSGVRLMQKRRSVPKIE